MKPVTHLVSLSVLACLLVCGCGNPDRTRLVGTWNIAKPDSMMGRLNRETGASEESEAEIALNGQAQGETVEASSPKMQIQFLGNGTLATITQMGRVAPKPKQGRWEFISFDQASSKMKVKCTLELQETEHEIEFLDPNTIKLVPPNMAGVNLKVKFTRQR